MSVYLFVYTTLSRRLQYSCALLCALLIFLSAQEAAHQLRFISWLAYTPMTLVHVSGAHASTCTCIICGLSQWPAGQPFTRS